MPSSNMGKVHWSVCAERKCDVCTVNFYKIQHHEEEKNLQQLQFPTLQRHKNDFGLCLVCLHTFSSVSEHSHKIYCDVQLAEGT